MKKYFYSFVICLFCSGISWAIDLQTAKQRGLVGEQPGGYIGIVKPDSNAEVSGMVRDINAKRKNLYQSIANRNKVDLIVVEKMAGKKAINKTPVGQYYKTTAGKWVVKR